jgi:hypothetical protein
MPQGLRGCVPFSSIIYSKSFHRLKSELMVSLGGVVAAMLSQSEFISQSFLHATGFTFRQISHDSPECISSRLSKSTFVHFIHIWMTFRAIRCSRTVLLRRLGDAQKLIRHLNKSLSHPGHQVLDSMATKLLRFVGGGKSKGCHAAEFLARAPHSNATFRISTD